MNRIPLTRFRPVKTSDGEGGLIPAFGIGVLIYGAQALHDFESVMIVDRCESVKVEDILVCADEFEQDEAFYRVTKISQPPRGRNRIVHIERIDKPLWPIADLDYLYVDGDQLFFDGQPLTVQ